MQHCKSCNGKEGYGDGKKAAELATKRRASEDELMLAYSLYSRIGEKDKSKELGETIKKKYSKGSLARGDIYTNFRKEKDLEEKRKLHQKYAKLAKEENQGTLDYLSYVMATSYGADDLEKADEYIAQISSNSTKANTLNRNCE